ATGLFHLLQERGTQRGFIVLMPVYRHGATLTDTPSRRAAVSGFTAAVFRSSDLIAKALAVENPGMSTLTERNIDINVNVGNLLNPVWNEESLIFGTGKLPSIEKSAFGWLLYDQPQPYRQVFQIAGKTWRVEVATPPALFTKRSSNALWALLAALLFSGGTAFCMQVMANRSRRIQKLVDERTLQLRSVN